MLNGEQGEKGVRYLVRDDYFEPALGHRAEQAVKAFQLKSDLGRPCLLETHRFNFLGENAEASLAELDRLLSRVLAASSHVRFLSPIALLEAMSSASSGFLALDFGSRLYAWVARARRLPTFSRLGRLAGVLALLEFVASLAVKQE